MPVEQSPEHSSSWLVHPYAVVIWVVLFITSIIYSQMLLAAFFLSVSFVTLTSLLWCRYISAKVSAEIVVTSTRVFPGQEITMNHCIRNEKFWPVIWLDWSQTLPDVPIVAPADINDVQCENLEMQNKKCFYNRKSSWIMWFDCIKWQSLWKAERRGIYEVKEINLVSGDGFGLSVVRWSSLLKRPLKLVIYPALVYVNPEKLFNHYIGTKAGENGFIEDPTLNKGTRDFQMGDSWKRINWRLASAHKTLQVNIYETMKYESVCFIVDAKSFNNSPQKEEDFEDALSILASSMVVLIEKHIPVGLYTPASSPYPAQYYPPAADETSLAEMLEALSGLSLKKSEDCFLKMPDSVTDHSETKIYLVAYGLDRIDKLSNDVSMRKDKKWTILSYQGCSEKQPANTIETQYSIIDMKSLKQK